MARRLAEANARRLLIDAFGSCPAGFRGSLRRLGARAHPPALYAELYRIHHDPALRPVARALGHVAHLDRQRVAIALAAPPALLRPGLLAKLDDLHDLRDFVEVLELIKQVCPTASDAVISESLRRLSRAGNVAQWVTAWITRAILPLPPVAGDDRLVPIRTAREMTRLGRQMRNCLRERIIAVLAGEAYFYRYVGPKCIIAELCPLDGGPGWRLEDVHAFQSGPIQSEILADIKARFDRLEVLVRGKQAQQRTKWHPVERLAPAWLGGWNAF